VPESARLDEHEETLITGRRHHLSLIDEFPGIVYRLGTDHVPVFLQGAVEAVTGYREEDFRAGRPRLIEIAHPDDLSRLESIIGKACSTLGFSREAEVRVVRKDRQIRWTLWSIHNIRDEHGEPKLAEGLIYDITERKRMEDKLSALHWHALQLANADDVDEIVGGTLDAMEFTLGFDHADFCLTSDGSIYIRESRGMPRSLTLLPSEGPSVIVKAAKTKRPLRIADTTQEPAFLDSPATGPSGETLHMLSELAVPVIPENEVVAVLNVENTRVDAFTEQDQVLLETLAAHVASCITHLREKQALDGSASLVRATLESTADGILVVDRKGNVSTFNRRFAEMWHIPDNLLETRDHVKLLQYVSDQLEDPERFTSRTGQLYSEPEKASFDVLRFKDGRAFERYSQPQRIGSEIVGRVWSFRDATKRIEAEELLRESEARYRTLFDNASDAIFIHDMGGRFLEVNKVACDRLGYTREELLQKTPKDIDAPEYASQVAKRVEEVCEKRHAIYENAHVRRGGTIIPIELSSRLIEYKGKPAILSIARDISGRVEYERKLVALHKHASQLAVAKTIEEIVESTLDVMQTTLGFDIADVFTVQNGHMVSSGVRGIPLAFLGPLPDGHGIVWKAATRRSAVRVGDVRTEAAYVDRSVPGSDGPPTMYSEMAVPVIVGDQAIAVLNVESIRADAFTDQDQKLLETLAYHVGSGIRRLRLDEELRRYSEHLEELVSERTRKLSESEKRFRELADMLPQIVFETDEKGNLTFGNRAGFGITGYSQADIDKGLTALDLFSNEDQERVRNRIARVLAGEKSAGTEYVARRKDGSTFPVIIHTTPILSGNRAVGLRGIAIDITEREKTEKHLLRVERLAAIGETARMIGHDLRNPLQGISGAATVLSQHFGSRADKMTMEMLQTIDGCVNYANGIVGELLDYTGELRLDFTKTDLKELSDEAVSVIRLPDNISISNLTESGTKMQADVEKIRRVLVNLIENAIAAMPKGGRIKITSKARGNMAEIQVTDNGVGIAKKEMRLIWKPFHTTKARGIGLGLAICKRMIEAHDGTISVRSTVGKGTTFTIRLPREPSSRREASN
jgi:PAS domain S-box-containing protein